MAEAITALTWKFQSLYPPDNNISQRKRNSYTTYSYNLDSVTNPDFV